MFGQTHMIRRTGMIIALGVSVAAFAVPTALGQVQRRGASDVAQATLLDGRSPDTLDAAYQAQLPAVTRLIDGRSPDTLDSAYQARLSLLGDGRSPDTLDAAYQAQLSKVTPLFDGRSPDTLDAATQAKLSTLGDFRSPDAVDAGVLGRTQVVEITSNDGFNWGDFGIGVAVALGTILVLVGLGAGMREARQARHRLGSA
jgi:hypothetical protein